MDGIHFLNLKMSTKIKYISLNGKNTIFCTFEKYTLHQQSVGLSQKLNQD
jgi:hypothetical protein